MEIGLSTAAIQWFKDEVELKKGDKVRFYVKIYGSSPVQEGFSLAFTVDNEPIDIGVKTESEGLTFFIEGSDLWFFNGHDLFVDYNKQVDELEFSYTLPRE
ncbi:HesB/YadR/YfhF family protein [Bacillus sp. AFS076308]|uniref:HesB/YadR/YfhF family protein n=1 Tax=unclassified Bacillus (in: firmicutes) TaxID=185979 RepID=UPI000BF95205|nr:MULTISPECIES: HesB/YadR/YfhF family protein [unclassified Bacillus (in: firmicutes)]PFO10223.1 HesB/YadR/YfhF family protein [Bacillus sp. AFS076308]PGV48564.1 HesB/YadR/YfhF family protein [Bacillus sp. AFS037270]